MSKYPNTYTSEELNFSTSTNNPKMMVYVDCIGETSHNWVHPKIHRGELAPLNGRNSTTSIVRGELWTMGIRSSTVSFPTSILSTVEYHNSTSDITNVYDLFEVVALRRVASTNDIFNKLSNKKTRDGNLYLNYLTNPMNSKRLNVYPEQVVFGQDGSNSFKFPSRIDVEKLTPAGYAEYSTYSGDPEFLFIFASFIKAGYIFEFKTKGEFKCQVDKNYARVTRIPANEINFSIEQQGGIIKRVEESFPEYPWYEYTPKKLKLTIGNSSGTLSTITLKEIYSILIDKLASSEFRSIYHESVTWHQYATSGVSPYMTNIFPSINYVDQEQSTGTLKINENIKIEVDPSIEIIPDKTFNTIHYNRAGALNLRKDVNVVMDGFKRCKITSATAMNILVEVYEAPLSEVEVGTARYAPTSNDSINRNPIGVYHEDNNDEITFLVPRGGCARISAWSLGKASYYFAEDYDRIHENHSIEWVDYEKDILDLNALIAVQPRMSSITAEVVPLPNGVQGVQLVLPEMHLNADEAKMVLHLLAGSPQGLKSTLMGANNIVSRINIDRFSVFAPVFTVVKNPSLTADQKVIIDLFIDSTQAIKVNPSYVPNPYNANGRVELPDAPRMPAKTDSTATTEPEEPAVDAKSVAQETVETLLRHPQFLSTATMSLTLDK